MLRRNWFNVSDGASAARTLCGFEARNTKVLLVANTSDECGEILLYNGCRSFPSPAQNAFSLMLYVVKSQISGARNVKMLLVANPSDEK